MATECLLSTVSIRTNSNTHIPFIYYNGRDKLLYFWKYSLFEEGSMSTDANSFSGKEKRPLTRVDVEKRIQLAGGRTQIDLTGEDLREANLSYMRLIGII